MSKTTRQISDLSLARAIAYFSEAGCKISVPLTDNQEYDLIIDEKGSLKKVEIKTGSTEKNGFAVIYLKSIRPNRTTNIIRPFDNTKVDYLFCDTSKGIYVIPAKEIEAKSELRLTDKYEMWRGR